MTPQTQRVVSVALALLFGMLLTVFVLLQSSWAEERARVLVEAAVTEAIPGSLVIDRLGDFEIFTSPGNFGATAENIRLLDEDGEELLNISEVSGELDLGDLLFGDIHVPRASINGAQIFCDLDTGRPRVARAKPEARRKAFEPRSGDLRMENVKIVGLYAVAAQPEKQKVILGRLEGVIELKARGAVPGIEMHVWGFKGDIAHPKTVRLHDATGIVDTSAYNAADIRFRADVPGAALTGRMRYVPKDTADPIKFDIEKMREVGPGLLGNTNPLDAIGGAVPADIRKMIPGLGR